MHTVICMLEWGIGESMNQSAEQQDRLARCLVRSIRGRVQWSGMKNTRMIFARWRSLGDAMITDLHDVPDTPSLLFHDFCNATRIYKVSFTLEHVAARGQSVLQKTICAESVTWCRLLFPISDRVFAKVVLLIGHSWTVWTMTTTLLAHLWLAIAGTDPVGEPGNTTSAQT